VDGATDSWRQVLVNQGTHALQEALNTLLDAWVAFEDTRGYNDDSNRNMPTDSRPLEVRWWISHTRRDPDRIPNIDNLHDFSQSWWGWLAVLSPEWRSASLAPGPSSDPNATAMSRTIPPQAEWSHMTKGGSKGMLLVLACVVWWGTHVNAEDKKATENWLRAVDELTWIFQHAVPANSASSDSTSAACTADSGKVNARKSVGASSHSASLNCGKSDASTVMKGKKRKSIVNSSVPPKKLRQG
jgi:hypothetical protein